VDYKLIAYDFEVFKFLWMVVIIDYDTREKTVIVNDTEKLKEFYINHCDDIFLGYNSRNYDQFILKGLLLGKDPFWINNEIIKNGKKGNMILRGAKNIKLNNFDIATGFHSLKQLEAFMGNTIKETSIPFDLDRKLTPDEIEETITYCTHDVLQTIEVFERRKEEFTSQLGLIETFELPMTNFTKTKAQLSALVLGTIPQPSIDDEFVFTIPDTIRLNKYKFVLDWYKNPRNWTYQRKLEVLIAGIPHTFAYGGIHGSLDNCTEEGIILCCDVASLYPSIMIEYDFLSRNVMNAAKYTEIRNTRLILKKAKDKRQAPYKILLNATYGCLKDPNNPLYDPLMSNNVCVAGQLMLLDLIEKVENYGQLLQSNTDGIYLKVKDMETVEIIKGIAKEWEIRTRLNLEWDIANKLVQKDVNNYILLEDGECKSKGSYVKKLSEIDNDLPIVNKALKQYFLENIPVEDTINQCDNLIEFQKVVKITGLYKYALHGDVKVSEKVLRVFASSDKNAPGVFKVKGIDKIEKLANTPDKCFIWNDSVVGVKVPVELDKQYYIDVANNRITGFIEVAKEPNHSAESQVIEILNKNYDDFYDVLVDIKLNTNVGAAVITKFIKIDVFKTYGKAGKILAYVDYFNSLYSKKNPKQPMLQKTISSDEVFSIIESNSQFDDGVEIMGVNKKGVPRVEKKACVPSYKLLDFEKALKEIWNIILDIDIDISVKLRQEFAMYEDVSIIDSTTSYNELFVLNVNETKNPSIIAYCINNGSVQFLKIKKALFEILEIKGGDMIRVDSFEEHPVVKVLGKDDYGVNIIGEDNDKKEWWILAYDVISRDYAKSEMLTDTHIQDYIK